MQEQGREALGLRCRVMTARGSGLRAENAGCRRAACCCCAADARACSGPRAPLFCANAWRAARLLLERALLCAGAATATRRLQLRCLGALSRASLVRASVRMRCCMPSHSPSGS